MRIAELESLRSVEAQELAIRAERAWLASNELAKRKELLRENSPIIDLSFGTLGGETASLLGREAIFPGKTFFPNREFKLRFPGEIELPKGVYLVGSFPLLEDIGGLQFTGDYLREKGVEEITAVCSFLGFTRQDRRFMAINGRVIEEATSLRSVMRSLAQSVDRLIVLDPHSEKTVEYGLEFGLPVLAISGWRYLADKVKPFLEGEKIIVAGPDIGRRMIAGKLADYWGCQRIAFRKERDPITGKVTFAPLTPEEIELVRGKTVAAFDDVITKGETIGGMADLVEPHAKQMFVLATHREFAQEAAENLNKPIITKILVTDSRLPLQEQPILWSKIEVISLAPFLKWVVEEDGRYLNPWKSSEFEGILIG